MLMLPDPSQTVGPSDSALPGWVTSGLAVAVILGAFGAAVGMLFRGGFTRSERFRLTLAMLCFALSSLSGLLFANQSASELIGRWGAVTLSLVGPAALWLIALIVVTKLWKDDDRPEIATPTPPVERGLLPYSEWKFKHAGLNYLFTSYANEEYRVSEILTFAYFRAPEKRKPIDVHIATAFIYFSPPDRPHEICFIKLQRILGTSRTPPTHVYHIFRPTLPGGSASSFMFVRAEGKLLGCAAGGPGSRRWLSVETSSVDCLVVSTYPSGNPPEGDYAWIDVPKYSDSEVVIDLSFLARRPIAGEGDRASKLWEVLPAWSSAPASASSDVPVQFKLCTKGHVSHTRDEASLRRFSDWLPCLDALVRERSALRDMTADVGQTTPADPLRFLDDLLASLRAATGVQGNFTEVLAPSVFPHVCEFEELTSSRPLIATFQFE